MRTELVGDAAGALAWAALTVPLGGGGAAGAAGGVVVDPGTETLVAPPAAFRELVEPGSRLEMRAALAAGGAVHGGRVPPLLRAGVEAVRAPARTLTLTMAGRDAGIDVWLAGAAAALTTVEPDGRVRLVPLPAGAVVPALARAMGLAGGPGGPAPSEASRRLAPGALASLLAAGGGAELPGVHAHARLEAPDGVVEIIGAADGWRRVLVDGDDVVLEPVTADDAVAAVAALVAPAQRA